jgi:penicillin-binding protein 1C
MTTLKKPAGHYGLSLILGGAEGTLEEMTNIYACFSRVLNHYAGTGLYFPGDYRPLNYRLQSSPRPEKGISQPGIVSASALWFTYMAMDEVNRPEEESGWKAFSSSRKIAWKTGTSFGYRDGWAIGTSPDYVVGVWVGNADGEGRPGLTGIAAAAPLLFEIFGVLPRSGWFGAPLDELVPVRVCSKSGYLAGMHCDGIDTVKVQLNGTRARTCPYHRLVHLSRDLEYRVNSNCYPVDSMNHLSWFVLPPVQEWYYKKRHSDYNSLPPFKTGCEPGSQRNMDLIYPHEETKIFIPVELDGRKGRVIFEAVHNDPEATLYWHIDDRFVTATQHIHQIEILPEKGKHRLILIDESGEELVKNFELVEN